MKKGVQSAICCPCGNEKILALGLCATCYTLKRQDAEYFGGLREQVLERDGYACRVCGDPDPGVHHREPGKSILHLMIALCAGCHAKVHRTKVVLTEFPPLLLELWREQLVDETWVGGTQAGLRGSRQLKGRKAALAVVAVEKRGRASGRVRMAVIADFRSATLRRVPLTFSQHPEKPEPQPVASR